MNRFLLMVMVFLAATGVALGQCGPGGCRVAAPIERFEWRDLAGDPGRIYLYKNGRQIGGWDYDAGHWRDYDVSGDIWSAPVPKAPVEPPVRVTRNFGVDSAKLHGGARFQLNGVDASKEQVIDAIHAKIPEESKKFRVTIIGGADDRQRVAEALPKIEAPLRERLAVWSVPADHWSLTDTATGKPVFRTDGKPTIYVQAPDGKVLHRQGDFGGVQDFEAIRKAVKNYDGAKDPDLRKAAPDPAPPAPLPPVNPTAPGLVLALGLLGYLFVTRRR